MLDIKFIRKHKEEIKKNCVQRNIHCDIDELLALDEKRKILLAEIENLQAEKNKLIKAIQNVADKTELIARGKEIKEKLDKLEPEFKKTLEKQEKILREVPNLTHPDSPIGKSDKENKEIERYGKPPQFDFTPRTHEEIMNNLDLIDFERAAKVSGSKFYYLKNESVLLEMALIQFAFRKLLEKGFTPFTTPDLARDKVLSGVGFNPRGKETQIYSVENSDLSLVGTAEITMGGYHMEETILEEKLPLKYVAFSHCFRTEAGSYGRHSSGLYRVHQFSKVEMFVYCAPEDSEKIHEELKNIEVEIFQELGVPFRVVDICTGDLGGPAYRKYDLEAWMVSKNGWGEITSTSNTTDYQARRLNIKLKRSSGEKEYLHTLNGTAISIARALIAILENYQQSDGSVIVPEVLREWMPNKMEKIERKK